MATHSSVLAWRIPGTGEPDGLLSMGSHRVGHDWSDLAAAAAAANSIVRSRDITLLAKPSSQSYGFSSNHIWIWELACEESWAPKNWCFWTVVLEKTLESPLDCKGIQPVNPKENQSWLFIERTDVEAEALILWPPNIKNWLTGEDPHAGKDWRWEEKGTTEDEMVGWHHRHEGHESE